MWKFFCLISVDGVAHIVDMCENVTNFAAMELIGSKFFERGNFGLGRADVLACFIKVPLGCLCGFGIVFLDIIDRQKGPTNEIASFNDIEPSGLDRVPADSMHPTDNFLGGY